MSFKRRLHTLLQKLLFLWIRVETLPKDLHSDIHDGSPVLYVLSARGISELLVLERMTSTLKLHDPLEPIAISGFKHHSIYSVASRNPLSDWILQQQKHSLMLEELITAITTDETLDIKIVPVSVYWGRPLAKQRHWLKVLFSDTWEVANKIRKLFTILVNGRKTTLIFSPPQSFRSLCDETNGSAERMNELLRLYLRQQREATFGPEITTRNKFINKIVNSDNIQQALQTSADKKNKSPAYVRKQAIKYCREIFSDCTQITQELMKRMLAAFWNRFYSGIKVFNIEPVKQIALTHQLVYVPCHRSHVDYLLLSYVIFHEGLALPYIAAGNNLDMPIIGKLLRGGGAFFIRRSFKNNPLYAAVMNEYVLELIDMGVPIEYFIEGGRSRTGRLLQPKLGMLSMTVDSWIKTQKKPMAFIPVYIGYEKLIEGNSYIGELYGQIKKKENLFTSIKSILALKGKFGIVTTSFGQPIKLDELLQQHAAEWKSEDPQTIKNQDWYRPAIGDLSHQIMLNINAAAVVNPVNLIATTMLATPRQSIDEFDLLQQCEFYKQLIQSQPYLETITLQDSVTEEELKRIEQQGLIHIREHKLGNIIYLKPEHAILISYYRNNSLHTLILPSLVACCFLNIRTIKQEKLISIVRYVYPFLAAELHLPWCEKQLDEFIPQIIDFLVDKKILIRTAKSLKRPDRSDVHYLMMTRLAHIAQPILERYYMTFVVLWESGETPLSESELEQRCHLVAQKVSMLYGINSPDFFDRHLFGHFINTLFELDFIERDENGHLLFQQSFNQVNMDIRILLSLEVRSTILQLLNSSHHHDLADNSYH
ncbi:MAG: glycerol-3-phosphate 1-O-acyltransferase PlsB [Gammaproteobacteria bacterium]|nr:glycerol-3-phosphate 1-O-acyltransferase PlsB [Gammaproteobacteria bacterium]